MRSSSSLAGPTYCLAVIATLMLQCALYDRQGMSLQELLHLAVVLAITFSFRASKKLNREKLNHFIHGLGFAVLVLAPFIWNAIGRTTGQFGHPSEVLIALSLRNMMLGLVTSGSDLRSKMFASLASCFLALFSLICVMNLATNTLLLAYTITGMWWLLGAYWDRLSDCFLTQSERAIPWKPALCATALTGLVALILLPLVNVDYYTTAIQGFFPSSGGTGSQDEFAFGGVGDGPQMVGARENASSFGPIESELFLESKMPSLYDVFNETSDPPQKPKKRKRLKTIPLAPSQAKPNHQRRAINKNSGREFSTVRKQKRKPPTVQDLRSKALLQIAGRVPIHLSMQAYDLWDGHKLKSSNSVEPRSMTLVADDFLNKNWVRFDDFSANDVMDHREKHEIRVINIKTARVPSPPNLYGIHIDKIHTKRFFNTTQDGMLAMDVDFIPQLSVLHFESFRCRSSQMPTVSKRTKIQESSENKIANLAREWTDGISEGWPQIEAICMRLRQEYTLDPKALVSQDVDDAAEYFLFEAKRGPDYLFATSAALLLQSLGYETRVVSGFYADPKNYDRQSRLTSIYSDDAHFWIEVLASPTAVATSAGESMQNIWLTAEPSPGYEVLYAPETIWSLLMHQATRTIHVLRRNPLFTLAMLASVVTFWRKKADVCDSIVTFWWRLNQNWSDVRQQVLSTLRLLDRRARIRGCPRLAGVTINKWRLTDPTSKTSATNWEQEFHSLADWALYADGQSTSYSHDEVSALCRVVATIALRPSRKPSIPTSLGNSEAQK